MGPMTSRTQNDAAWYMLFAAWLISAVAVAGSLFFSSVMQLPPCLLCWYQRIAIFPLALILLAGLFPFDRNVVRYALPLAAVGWLIAVYHNLIYVGLVPERIQPCSQGVSCAERNLALFGFVSIPLLSLLGLTAIIALLTALNRRTAP